MSATSSRTYRGLEGTDELVGTTRGRPVAPRESALHALVATDGRAAGTIARLALGLVMFPHGAQKMLGWFGGYGLTATFGFLTAKAGLPGPVAGAVIFVEFVSAVLLVAGLFTRLAAFGIMAIMIGAILTTHLPNGFFMNWAGNQAGEGFEYHLLAIGLALVAIVLGGGAGSIDRALTTRRQSARYRQGGVVEPVTRD